MVNNWTWALAALDICLIYYINKTVFFFSGSNYGESDVYEMPVEVFISKSHIIKALGRLPSWTSLKLKQKNEMRTVSNTRNVGFIYQESTHLFVQP